MYQGVFKLLSCIWIHSRVSYYELIKNNPFIATAFGLAAMTKAMLKSMGVDLGPPRLPMKAVTPDCYRQMQQDLTDIGFYEWSKP